ncbi:MAG: protein translocase subunit SecD [Nocardioides sp.]
MARQQRHGRTVIIFLAAMGVCFGLVALAGSWAPRLGLDLQGGTRITLQAKGEVTSESLAEAADIIDQRVNGSGVSESEVTTQGSNIIVVEIPGKTRRDLVDTVKRQAQMRFRVVARTDNGVSATTDPSATGSVAPGTGVLAPPESSSVTGSPQASPSGSPSGSASGSPTADPKQRPALVAPSDSAEPSKKPSVTPSPDASPTGSSSPAPTATTSAEPGANPGADPDAATSTSIDDPLAWSKDPDRASVAKFEKFSCPPPGQPPVVSDNPAEPLVTCDEDGIKYLLSKAMIEGSELRSASPGLVDVGWVVNIAFKGDATSTFADISRDLYGSERQFAVVLDGTVISAPTMDGLITDGRAYIQGNFTQSTAQSLATSLKFGALPVAFEKDINVQTIGASLAGNQLQAGIAAGALGLLLVMIYCLFYYRGLGLVVLGSLVVAAALTYAMVMLLSETAGFTLSLPGIAGLIVAVGITADSFVVFFERIRDEMRDGKSMRVAVEAGWVRARNTCLAADAVSLLAAVVLFIFAAGVVKGFAFALGLSTIIDLVVFFWFTKPLVSWLATYSFFNRGHRMSGLSAETLGIDRINLTGTTGRTA